MIPDSEVISILFIPMRKGAKIGGQAQENCTFDGKLSVCAYVEWSQEQKKSKNRLVNHSLSYHTTCGSKIIFICTNYMCFIIHRKKGEWELKPADSMDKAKSREYLVKYVLQAIKEKCP